MCQKNEKAKDLFAHLPYIANLQDPILQNRVEDLLKNRTDLQNYLLATEDLSRTLKESLQLALSHGKLNDETAVRHLSEQNDPKYKYFKENNNPLDVVYREKAKFDIQNPIIGSLLKQINKSKCSTGDDDRDFTLLNKKLGKAPNPKDLSIQDRFNKVFERNSKKKNNFLDPFYHGGDDDDDDDDLLPGSPGMPPAPPIDFDFNFDQQDSPLLNEDLNSVERDYFDRDIPIYERDSPKQINLDGNLRKIFPDADEALNVGSVRQENNEYTDFVEQLDRGEIPEELEFFTGGQRQAKFYFLKLTRTI